jgi:hypothetical protein
MDKPDGDPIAVVSWAMPMAAPHLCDGTRRLMMAPTAKWGV